MFLLKSFVLLWLNVLIIMVELKEFRIATNQADNKAMIAIIIDTASWLLAIVEPNTYGEGFTGVNY